MENELKTNREGVTENERETEWDIVWVEPKKNNNKNSWEWEKSGVRWKN